MNSVIDGDSGALLETTRQQIQRLNLTSVSNVAQATPEIKRTAWHLKHPNRSELVFAHGQKSGAVFEIAVSEAALDRALKLADQLVLGCAALDWDFRAHPAATAQTSRSREPRGDSSRPPICGEFRVLGERVGIRIEERFTKLDREPTAAELARERREWNFRAQRKVQIATGHLRVLRLDTYQSYGPWASRLWYDRKGTPVEAKIPEILLSFLELALSIQKRRAEDERKRRADEEARRHAEELLERQNANGHLITQLETDAGAWHRARFLRRYILAARRTLAGREIPVRYLQETVSFLDWADRYVEQLDPLTAQPRDADFKSTRDDYGRSAEDEFETIAARLSGQRWEVAWKNDMCHAAPPRDSNDWRWSHRQPSVFEVEERNEEDDD